MDIVTYALCKKIASSAVSGIKDIHIEDTTLYIETNDGEILEMVFPTPEDGVSITDVDIDNNKHLICTMSNGNTIDAGEVPMYIPQVGVDYFTDEDKEQMVSEVKDDISEYFTLDII
jgi:hypothetical protein